jgi:hypothetical protein
VHRWVNKHHGTIRTGFGAARLDLTAACWDDDQINLRLETRGSIEVLVPEGVAVQMVSRSGRVHSSQISGVLAWSRLPLPLPPDQ